MVVGTFLCYCSVSVCPNVCGNAYGGLPNDGGNASGVRLHSMLLCVSKQDIEALVVKQKCLQLHCYMEGDVERNREYMLKPKCEARRKM
jgi:hypothetical protein